MEIDGARHSASERPEINLAPPAGRRSVSQDAMKQLVDGLYEDLQRELQPVTVLGPSRQGLSMLHGNEIPGNLLRAQILSDTIAALGRTPTCFAGSANFGYDAKSMLQTLLDRREDR